MNELNVIHENFHTNIAYSQWAHAILHSEKEGVGVGGDDHHESEREYNNAWKFKFIKNW